MGNNVPVGVAYADPDLQAVTCTTLAASGAVTAASTLAVTGATTLSSTLAVTGAVTPTGGVPRVVASRPPLASATRVVPR